MNNLEPMLPLPPDESGSQKRRPHTFEMLDGDESKGAQIINKIRAAISPLMSRTKEFAGTPKGKVALGTAGIAFIAIVALTFGHHSATPTMETVQTLPPIVETPVRKAPPIVRKTTPAHKTTVTKKHAKATAHKATKSKKTHKKIKHSK
jgi:hypothetical protein